MSEAEGYPLKWPMGWRRTAASNRKHGHFSKGERALGESYTRRRELSTADAIARLLAEFRRFGIPDYNVIVSTNVELSRSGMPRSGREPQDPGVAVYFKQGDDERCIAADAYDRVADNLAAVAATIDALRAIDRHGGAQIIKRAFAGFAALPSPERHWKVVLGLVSQSINRHTIESAYKNLRSAAHPDKGGNAERFDELRRAYEQALMETPE